MSATMSEDLNEMQPVAAALAVAIEDWDPEGVAEILTSLDVTGLYRLAVFLAANVDVDAPLGACTSPEQVTRMAITHAAAAFDVPVTAVLGRTRRAPVSNARSVAIAVVARSGSSVTETGRLFGRDHSTVSHHVARVDADPRLTKITRDLCDRILLAVPR